ncbi:hypothetical protein JKP88DRAFT_149256, partial [Tribonema minus]
FRSLDSDGTGRVDCEEFLWYINAQRTPLTELVFGIVGADPHGALDFSAWLVLVLTYCLFTRAQILQFCFSQYDSNNTGCINEFRFMELLDTVNNASPVFPGNFQLALEEFDQNKDGLIDFNEFKAMDKRYPLLLFPVYRLQDAMQKACLGESAWVKLQQNMYRR